jgi:3-carboxy-cis,cis-muconate cycloisomerase
MSDRPSLNPGFTTPGMESVFSPEATLTSILEFEAALAMGLADAGIAPEAQAGAIARACRQPVADAVETLASTWESGTPLLALRREVLEKVEEEAAVWFHFGATTQDAVDTGLMLQARRGLEKLDDDLRAVSSRLRDMTIEYRDQPHMGRTFLQDARPTTFGLRTAGWLHTVLGHRHQLEAQVNGLELQLGGSNGTRSEYGDKASDVVDAVADRLGLAPSPITWHGDRTRITSIVFFLDQLASSMAKIATDVALLSSSPIAEIRVRSGSSSSMPEKANPVDSVRAVAAASACHGAVTMIGSSPPSELDRGVGSWHTEWLAVPLAFRTAAASVDAMRTCLESLEVDRAAMSGAVTGEIDLAGALAQIDHVLDEAIETL